MYTVRNTLSNDDLPRVLRREWKRNKPHLPKSTSLPDLQLLPTNRPLFTCRRCGFANTLIPLCLWCSWTSEEAHHEFDQSMPRARRASAPPRVVWSQIDKPPSKRRTSSSSKSSPSKTVPQPTTSPWRTRLFKSYAREENGRLHAGSIKNGENVKFPSPRHSARGEDWIMVDIDAGPVDRDAIIGTNRVASLNSTRTASASLRSGPTNRREEDCRTGWGSNLRRIRVRHPLPALLVSVDRRPPAHSEHHPDPSMSPTSILTKLTTKPSRPSFAAPIFLDFSHHESHVVSKVDSRHAYSASVDSSSTKRTLRRKRDMMFHAPSSPALASDAKAASQRPQSHPFNRSSTHSPTYLPLVAPATTKHTHARAHSQPNNIVRLGHPSRPYYSAIRKDAARPISLIDHSHLYESPNSSRPTSMATSQASSALGGLAPYPEMAFLDDPFRRDDGTHPDQHYQPPRQKAFSAPPPPPPSSFPSDAPTTPDFSPPYEFAPRISMSGLRSGFSMSGETELRMALARERAQGAVGERGGGGGEYRFQDMEEEYQRGLMGRVKKLRRGLKHLIRKL